MKFTKITKINGEVIIKNSNGDMVYRKDPDGTEYKWGDRGNIIYEKYPNGVEYKYNDNGDMVYRKDPDGTEHKGEPKEINANSLDEVINLI